jgi:Aerotolerance regulator N-terminal
MNWLALSPVEVALLASAAAGLALWMYLHQHPVRRRVSTLRFWTDLPASAYRRRRRLREPWAFLAQVLFLILMIMALANPRWGEQVDSRRVVLLLDTSLWSQMSPAGESRWIDQERREADRVLNKLPASDEVLLLRADADTTPILPFTQDRLEQQRAIAQVQPSATVADLPRAFEEARAALAGARRGLLAYIGPGMVDGQQAHQIENFRQSLEPHDGSGDHPQFLIRLVGGRTPLENRGIARLALERDETQPDRWHVLAQLKNYGPAAAKVDFRLEMNGQSVGQQSVSVPAAGAMDVHDELIADQGGLLEARIGPADALEADNRSVVYVPPFQPIRIAVFTARASFKTELAPALSANPYLRAEFLRPGAVPAVPPDIAVYDSASLPSRPQVNSIYFIRGGHRSASGPVRLTDWNPQHPVTRWVRTRDVSLRNPAVLNVRQTDTVLAASERRPQMPLIVAREDAGRRMLLIGFDLRDSNLSQQPAFPLLIAGAVEWLTHPVDDAVDSLSAGELDLPGPAIRIAGPSGRDVPFARNGSNAHFLALDTGAYHVFGPSGATTFEVNAPARLPSLRLRPTALEIAPVAAEAIPDQGQDLWKWLVTLGMIPLWAEWWLFYRKPMSPVQMADPVSPIGSGFQKKDADSALNPLRPEVHDSKVTP